MSILYQLRPQSFIPFIFPILFVSIVFLLFCAIISAESIFIDVTESAGIHFVHSDGRSDLRLFNEFLGSGCGFFDYDNDGYLDIYFVNGAYQAGNSQVNTLRNMLYRNNGDGTFSNTTDVAGVGSTSYGVGTTVGDYDNDGDLESVCYKLW